MAVADGAGTRRLSAEGALLAVRLAQELFGSRLLVEYPTLLAGNPVKVAESVGDVLRDAFGALIRSFGQETARLAAESKAEPADFATTLTVVTLAPGLLLHASLGDGFVLVRAGAEEGEAQIHLLPRPQAPGEYFTETDFLTTDDAVARVTTGCVVDLGITGVLLSTDGLAQALLTDAEGRSGRPNIALANALLELLDTGSDEQQQDVRSLLMSERLAQTSGDDMTVVRAVRMR